MEAVSKPESVLASIDGWLERDLRTTRSPLQPRLIPEEKAFQVLEIRAAAVEEIKSIDRYVPPSFIVISIWQEEHPDSLFGTQLRRCQDFLRLSQATTMYT